MKQIVFLIISLCLIVTSFGQIPPGYYNSAQGLQGDALKSALHNIIDNHTEYSYDDLRDFILKDTDEDPNNSDNIILLYTGRSQSKSSFGGGANDWNREHVWAKSHGDFGNNPPCGTDAHHIRPTDASVNSSRGNKDFDNGGQQHPEATGCYYDSDSWEARDEVKGDIARMIFYMAVRYEGENGEPDLEVVDFVNTSPNPEHGKYSTLLEWHLQDPPDTFEIHRNNVIYSYQNNRNPFIDHPEYLNMIYNPTSVIDLEKNQESFALVYPNPVKEQIKIQLMQEYDLNNLEVELFDIQGRAINVSQQMINHELLMNVSLLDSGVYILLIKSDHVLFHENIMKL